MKKILVTVAAVAAFSFVASAQEAKQAVSQHQDEHAKKDEITLKEGKLVQKIDGKVVSVEKDITLKNGTVVLANGTVKTTDGKTVALKEGDVVTADGKIWNKKEAHEDKVMKSEVK